MWRIHVVTYHVIRRLRARRRLRRRRRRCEPVTVATRADVGAAPDTSSHRPACCVLRRHAAYSVSDYATTVFKHSNTCDPAKGRSRRTAQIVVVNIACDGRSRGVRAARTGGARATGGARVLRYCGATNRRVTEWGSGY